MTLKTEPTTRREPLSRERVLRAAIELADRDGVDALSMRRVGQALGVEAMSLYNHVANKEDLLDGVVETVVSEIDPAAVGADWKSTMRARILATRRAMLRHRWASEVIVSRQNMTPAMLAYMNSMAEIFRTGGFSVDLTHHAFHVLGSRVLGFTQELYDDSAQPSDDPEMMAIMLRQMATQYPYITEIASQVAHDEASVVGSGCDDQFEFEFALDLILDGLERLRAEQEAAAP